MPTVYSGTLTGNGTKSLSTTCVPTDFDYWVTTFPINVHVTGVAPYRQLRFAGWIQFFEPASNFTGEPDEAVSPPYYFNTEAADQTITLSPGDSTNYFAYWVQPGTSVDVNVSA